MLAADWALMFAAMMPPLVIAPLRHIRDRSFAKRRARAMLLFVAGYAGVWLAAGVVLEAMALVALLGGRHCIAVADLARQAVVPEPLPSPAASRRVRRSGGS